MNCWKLKSQEEDSNVMYHTYFPKHHTYCFLDTHLRFSLYYTDLKQSSITSQVFTLIKKISEVLTKGILH